MHFLGMQLFRKWKRRTEVRLENVCVIGIFLFELLSGLQWGRAPTVSKGSACGQSIPGVTTMRFFNSLVYLY